MKNQINPFQNLYVTERLHANEYVHLFSHLLVAQALPLFQTGNVVLQGTQGSGKTTLLALLQSKIRNAYRQEGVDFPVPSKATNFISAGINLTRSGALDFGRRPIENEIKDEEILPLFFADFFNYHIISDLMQNIKHDVELGTGDFKIDRNKKVLAQLCAEMKKMDCWFGFFQNCNSFFEIIDKVKWRILQYRLYHQFNLNSLPQDIVETKTAIGEPISQVSRAIKELGIISPQTEVFIRIDQLEILLDADEIRKNLGTQYRRMINSALSTRDPNVSYKIGTRTYAWGKELRTYRSNTKIEHQRDYQLIDFDNMLQRNENPSSWIYPDFAKDVFKRRLVFCGFQDVKMSDDNKNIYDKVFGKKPLPVEMAKLYCRNVNPNKALKFDSLPHSAKKQIAEVFNDNPLKAMLATAWAQQKGKDFPHDQAFNLAMNMPWTKYWQKERNNQALLQLAANCGQAPKWGGGDEIISLSAAGILGFLSLCQHIWDVFLRLESKQDHIASLPKTPDKIDIELQNIGILSASTQWFNKIAELPGGSDRQRFITLLGFFFREMLLEDNKMSYPGHNGFSLSKKELDENPIVEEALNDATDYGILISSPHTSKNKKHGPRIKWYLNPIYCPHFKIYENRTKEPYYTTPSEVEEWLTAAYLNKTVHPPRRSSIHQPLLFQE